MSTEQIISVIVAVLSGLATCIPLAVKLVQYVKQATQEGSGTKDYGEECLCQLRRQHSGSSR